MTETQQLERRELARRLIFLDDQLKGGTYLRCDMKGKGTDEDAFRPLIADLVPHCMSRQYPTPDGAMIVYVPASVVLPVLPRGAETLIVNTGCLTQKWLGKLRNLPEHERQRLLWQSGLEFGDFDTWAKPVADEATGLSSYAHTQLLYHDEFDGGDYDPLSSSPAWTILTASEYLKQVAASSWVQGAAATHDLAIERWDTTAQPPNDCSVTSNIDHGSVEVYPAIIGRMSDVSNFYYLRYDYTGLIFQFYKYVSGSAYLLGQSSTGLTANYYLRLEMVGTVLKGYVGTAEPLAELINVTDSTFTAGWAGIRASWKTASYPRWAYMSLYGLATACPHFFNRFVLGRRD